MIKYHKYILSNGLTLIVHEEPSTPLVSINTLFGVGSRDEEPTRTGFAHLFEHLMFGGTKAVPDFDAVVNSLGGESNAMTGNDFTNYYLTLPAIYLEEALRLEADRMRGLDLSVKSLSVQQSVVTEEYHYRYINQPYGDAWLLLRPLCYKVHPYRWNTIGADIRHVQEATLGDVKSFFDKFYCPANAIIAVSGGVKKEEVVTLVEKHYGGIEAANRVVHSLPEEPEQCEARRCDVERNIPSDAIYMAYHMCGRMEPDFMAADLVSDLLANGRSSRMFNALVKERKLFTEIDACVTGDMDPGLFVISGKLHDGVDVETAKAAVEEQLRLIAEEPVAEEELEKVVNKYEATFAFSHYKAIDCAMGLCYYDWLGKLELVNSEPDEYRTVTVNDIRRVASSVFGADRQSLLVLHKK